MLHVKCFSRDRKSVRRRSFPGAAGRVLIPLLLYHRGGGLRSKGNSETAVPKPEAAGIGTMGIGFNGKGMGILELRIETLSLGALLIGIRHRWEPIPIASQPTICSMRFRLENAEAIARRNRDGTNRNKRINAISVIIVLYAHAYQSPWNYPENIGSMNLLP